MENLILNLPKIQISPKFYPEHGEGKNKLNVNSKKFYLDLPENPGVYIYFRNKRPIYVGKAINLKKRVSSYFRLNLETKTRKMINDAEELSFIKVDNELEALLLEARLIKYFQPKYNIISKDDKHPLYIQITKEEFPRIITVRKTDLKLFKTIETYGPFPSSTNVKLVLKMIRRTIPFSDHKLGKRSCLYSQIGLCNPCPNVINEIDNLEERLRLKRIYKNNIRHIKSILDGKINKVKNELEKEMDEYSKTQEYEDAALIRNKIRRLEYITNPNMLPDTYLENPNLYQDQRTKESNELLKILRLHGIHLRKLHRIECYDIAHLQGESATASMVTFIDGEPEKKYYRHFRIYQKKGNDDYASMKEVSGRRIKHLSDWGKPDLIIVDGGKGQLGMFMNEFAGKNIPIIGLAKKFETLVIPTEYLGSKTFKEYRLERNSALNLVQRLRDEAHRFARVYHHKLLKKSLFER